MPTKTIETAMAAVRFNAVGNIAKRKTSLRDVRSQAADSGLNTPH
jgi:hypothetical protein